MVTTAHCAAQTALYILTSPSLQGIHAEIVPSTFEENLPKEEFVGATLYEYPVETSARKVSRVLSFLFSAD